MTDVDPRAELCDLVGGDEPASRLWSAIDSGRMAEIVPELPALRMEQDPIHRHKDVLAHTIAVVAKTPDDLVVRLAALFHDIGKPRTRSYEHGEVTFRHHEAVGARMTRKRLTALGFDERTVDDISELVRLSGRFKGFASGWSDAAVRRYARDAGPLLGRLNQLVRSDCTTRNLQKEADLHRQIDDLEHRIASWPKSSGRRRSGPRSTARRSWPISGWLPVLTWPGAEVAAGTQAHRGGAASRRTAGPARRLVGRQPLVSLPGRRIRPAAGPVASIGT